MTRQRLLTTAALGAVVLALAACGSSRDPGSSGRGGSVSKVPNKPYRPYLVGVPYTIKGKRYYPKENWNYTEIGVASWYGPGFHGKRTANGERYNQNALTAAHRTLPMPTLVKVTRMDDGRSVVVRINDRGPYADDRIIDLSKEAARRIGMLRAGTAEVKVTILKRESQALKRNRQVYANMAALNRRYVDGRGSGPVIASRPPADDSPYASASSRREPARPTTRATAETRPSLRPVRTGAAYGAGAAGTATAGAVGTGSYAGDGSSGESNGSGRDGRVRESNLKAPTRLTPARNDGEADSSNTGTTRRDDTYRRDDSRAGRDTRDDTGNADARRTRRAQNPNGTLHPLIPSRPNRHVAYKPLKRPAPAAGRIYVQAAAYTEEAKAKSISRRLQRLGPTRISAIQIRRTVFYQVRVGPVRSPAEGDRLLARVVSMGYRNARVVITPTNP